MEAAVNKLEALFQKADSDLNYVSLRLESEFSQKFDEMNQSELNPVKLMQRIKKAQEELKVYKQMAAEISSEKQELCSFISENLVSTKEQIQKLQTQAGAQLSCTTEDEEYLKRIAGEISTASGGLKLEENGEPFEIKPVNHSCSERVSSAEEPEQILTNTRRRSKDYIPVTKEEFMSVSSLVRGRVKLADVNKVYEFLSNHFKKNKKSSPLTPSEMTKMGLKITGVTGEAKLKVLRSLKIIQIDNKGAAKMIS